MATRPTRGVFEIAFYVAVCAGMAMGTASFLIIAGAFEALPTSLVLTAIVGAMLFCTLISFPIAEMAAMYPSSPGVRTYVRQAYSDWISLFVVFLYLIFVIIAAGAEAYMFGYVVKLVVPGLPMSVTALVLIAVVAGVNWLGVTPSRGTQIGTTAVLSVGVLALGASGFLLGGAAAPSPPVGAADLAKLPAVIGLCVFLFIGFEWVTPLGFGPDAYARKIPMAMPAGIALNGCLYLVFVLGISYVLAPAVIATTPAPQFSLASELWGRAGLYAALAVSAFATTSTFNAGVMGGARLVYALGRERRLPLWCAMFHAERGVPRGGVVLLALLSAASTLLIIAWDVQLAAACVASTLICTVYAALLLSARRLRKLQPKRRRSFQVPFGPTAMSVLALLVFGLGLASVATDPRYALHVGASVVACALFAAMLARWSIATAPKRADQAIAGRVLED